MKKILKLGGLKLQVDHPKFRLVKPPQDPTTIAQEDEAVESAKYNYISGAWNLNIFEFFAITHTEIIHTPFQDGNLCDSALYMI